MPGPVYVLRGVRRRMGRAGRYWQISRILVRRGLLPYQRGGRRSELATPQGRARVARSVRLAMEDGGVTFVKLGQVLSTRRDLLPAEFISELSRLQDDAVPVPWPAIEQVLRSELGAEVGELFASFDREPIAAASIAQVHAATLTSGARVVVKVCRPDVSETVERDLDITGRRLTLGSGTIASRPAASTVRLVLLGVTRSPGAAAAASTASRAAPAASRWPAGR